MGWEKRVGVGSVPYFLSCQMTLDGESPWPAKLRRRLAARRHMPGQLAIPLVAALTVFRQAPRTRLDGRHLSTVVVNLILSSRYQSRKKINGELFGIWNPKNWQSLPASLEVFRCMQSCPWSGAFHMSSSEDICISTFQKTLDDLAQLILS